MSLTEMKYVEKIVAENWFVSDEMMKNGSVPFSWNCQWWIGLNGCFHECREWFELRMIVLLKADENVIWRNVWMFCVVPFVPFIQIPSNVMIPSCIFRRRRRRLRVFKTNKNYNILLWRFEHVDHHEPTTLFWLLRYFNMNMKFCEYLNMNVNNINRKKRGLNPLYILQH